MRPWTPELRAEQKALSPGAPGFYSTPPIAKDPGTPGLARIRADATVSEPVRERAIEFVCQLPDPK